MLCHNLVAFQCEQPMSKVGVLYTFSQKLVIRHRSVDSWCRGTMLKRVKEFDLKQTPYIATIFGNDDVFTSLLC